MADAFLERFREAAKAQRKQRKSDELIEFIQKHWRAFARSKAYMEEVVDELVNRGELTVTSLLNALEIDQSVLVKRAPMTNTTELLLNPLKSPLYKTFVQLAEARKPHATTVLFVAGDHTVVLTNDEPSPTEQGQVSRYVQQSNTDRIHILQWADAVKRLPLLFNHNED